MPVLPFGIRGKFKVPTKFPRRQNEPSAPALFQYSNPDVIDIHDKATTETTQLGAFEDEEFVSKGSLDSTSTERRVYYEPLNLNISPEPLMSSFPPGFLKNSFIHPSDRDRRKTREGGGSSARAGDQEVDYSAPPPLPPVRPAESAVVDTDGFYTEYDDDAEDVIARLRGLDASSFVGIPSPPSSASPQAPSTHDLNHTVTTWKKSAPSPIKIVTVSGPGSRAAQQDERDATATAASATDATPASSSHSQVSSPASSAVSGTTLARALISNTFVLSIDTRDSRKYRSGGSNLTRSDSATLPQGDYSFLTSPYGGEDVPPVPPIPSEVLAASKTSTPQSLAFRRKTGDFRRRSSTGSLDPPTSSSPLASSDNPVSAVIDSFTLDGVQSVRRISRISEAPSSLPGTPVRSTNGEETEREEDGCHEEAARESSPEMFANESARGTEHQVEERAVEAVPQQRQQQKQPKPLPELPLSPTSTSEHVAGGLEQVSSPRDFDNDNVLDDYYSGFSPDSLPRGFRPAFSPITEVSEPSMSAFSPPNSSTTQKRLSHGSSLMSAAFSPSPLSPEYGGHRMESVSRSGSSSNRSHITRLPIRERPRSQLSTPSVRRHQSTSSSSGSDLIPPSLNVIFKRKRSGSAPSPILVVRDQERGRYRITMSPNSESPSSSFDAGQTFPETPNFYSPTWSAPSAPGTSTIPARRPREMDIPQTPMSASAATFTGAGQNLAQVALVNRAMTVGAPSTRQVGTRAWEPLARRPATIEEVEVNGTPIPTDDVSTSQEQDGGSNSHTAPVKIIAEHAHEQEASTDTISSTERLSGSTSSSHLQASNVAHSRVTTTPSPTLQLPTPFNIYRHPDSPPAYDTVFGDHLPQGGSTPITPGFDLPPNFRRSPNMSSSSLNQERDSVTARRTVRPRPRLPVGPRERRDTREVGRTRSVSTPFRNRNESVSSTNSTLPSGAPHSINSTQKSPQFEVPSARFKGVTMEAAKWTFTSTELQAIVSLAIKESAEGSSIRLLHLRTLENDIPEDLRRLEAEGREIQSKYKILSRQRQKLLDGLTNTLSSSGSESPGTSLRVVEALKEVTFQMDKLAEDLHSVDEQTACLNSLLLKHSGGALAMALRKLNKSWLEKVAELETAKLEGQRLEAERDEAYRQAEEVMRSTNFSFQQKANVRRLKAGLHSASKHSSFNSNRMSSGSLPANSAKSPFSFKDLPPIPPVPRQGRRVGMSIDIPTPTAPQAIATGPTPLTPDPRALMEQEELYGDIERRINSLRRSRSFVPLTAGPTPEGWSAPFSRQNSDSPSVPPRPSSLPGGSRLSDAYKAMNADTDAMLATLRMLSDVP